MNARQSGNTQEQAALKAGISVRSGRRIEKDERQEPGERQWRTRKDPFNEVWESELVPLLQREPELTGITLWEHLDDNYPGRFPESCLRALQRRIKQWRACEGPVKPVIFHQSVPPGLQGLSDFYPSRLTHQHRRKAFQTLAVSISVSVQWMALCTYCARW